MNDLKVWLIAEGLECLCDFNRVFTCNENKDNTVKP